MIKGRFEVGVLGVVCEETDPRQAYPSMSGQNGRFEFILVPGRWVLRGPGEAPSNAPNGPLRGPGGSFPLGNVWTGPKRHFSLVGSLRLPIRI